MADNYCVCEPYISGADAETITQGADFDLAEGVKAYDGYGNEIEYGYQPSELDTCEVGEHTVRYTAYGRGNRLVPQLCIPRGKSSLPSVCANDLERVTEDRVITILQADPPFFKGRGFNKNRLDPNTASDYEYGGLTWSFNEESGTVTVSGTYAKPDPEAPNDGVFTVAFMPEIEDGDYILTGCPSGGSEDAYYIEWLYLDSNEEIHTGIETGEGVTLNGIASGLVVTIYVKSGVAVSNLTFRPMLRLASVEDDTYEPYSGDSAMYVAPNTDFDPTDGVTATDANGNSVEYTYDGLYAEEASGDIASFETNVSAPLLSLLADIEPIQDLHGYDKPWAGGAGKNKFPIDVETQTINGVTFTVNEDGTVKANGTATANAILRIGLFSLPQGEYILSGVPSDGSSTTFELMLTNDNYHQMVAHCYSANDGVTFTVSGTTTYGIQIIIRSGQTMNNAVFSPMVRLASVSDSSYEPYSNICPISGWTDVDTYRTGVNVWGGTQLRDDILAKVPNAVADDTNKTIRYDASLVTGKDLFDKFKPNTQYTIILRGYNTNTSSQSENISIRYTDGTAQHLQGFVNGVSRAVSDASKSIKSIRGQWVTSATYLYYDECGVFEGNLTADDFAPYLGTTYTTTLGQTVYGGTLDVVSGELVVDRAMVDMGTLNWVKYSGNYPNLFYANDNSIKQSGGSAILGNAICSQYAICTETQIGGSGYTEGYFAIGGTSARAWVNDSHYTDVATFKTAMSGVQLVYELATPQTYQLTPQEVTLLLGDNNIWADSGAVEVVYQMQIPQGEDYQYPLEGNYQLIYTAEDKCGNIGRGTRNIIVADETFRTVVYDDGTLIINESSYDTASNLVEHGAVKATYDAMLEDGSNYIFNQNTPWTQNWTIANSITRVEIGSVIRPTSTAYWFYNLRMAEEFDLSKLDTSRVTDMNYMFGYISYSLSSGSDVYLDLSHFDTSNVTNMSRMFDHAERLIEVDVSGFDTSNVNYLTRMFGYCDNLETIYASGTFSTGQLWDSTEMFADDYRLVGGNGTAYNSSHMNYEYARLDNPPTEPGYFTAKE